MTSISENLKTYIIETPYEFDGEFTSSVSQIKSVQ